jgi:Flp pilus assembly pilin Flp
MTFKLLVLWLQARLDVRTDRGASAVEYALFLGFIAVVLILAVGFLGRQTARSLCPTC